MGGQVKKEMSFQMVRSSAECSQKLGTFNSNVNTTESKQYIDNCIDQFSSLLGGVASPSFMRNVMIRNAGYDVDDSNDFSINNKWYNAECFEKRRILTKC